MSKDYDVGYKKPPKQTQFQPGQSGNPQGRPKGTKNLSTDLDEELNQKILVTEGGKQQEVTKQRAMIKTLFAKAMQGNTQAAKALITLIIGLEQSKANNPLPDQLSEEDQSILDAFAERILSSSTDKK